VAVALADASCARFIGFPREAIAGRRPHAPMGASGPGALAAETGANFCAHQGA
jgi:hypothetical protein